MTTYSNDKEKQSVETDTQGNVIQTTDYFYDANGREAKVVLKNAFGKVIKTSSTQYFGKDSNRTEARDGSGQIVDVTIHNGRKTTYENYHNGKLLCSEEWTHNGENSGSVYKNSQGQVITKQEYKALRRTSQER